MDNIIADFTFEKETKNTVRYKEIETDKSSICVGTIYIQKSSLPSPFPQKIHMCISASDKTE